MAMHEFTVSTDPAFAEKFRELDAAFDMAVARKEACIRAGDVPGAEAAARRVARLATEIQDLLFEEMERHWAARLIEDASLPRFPKSWRAWVSGRLMNVEYEERGLFKDS